MSVHLDLPKYKCETCDKFSPVTTKRGKDIIVGCVCEKLCDSLEKLEKELEKQKDKVDKLKEESLYISKWKFIYDDDAALQPVFMPVTLPKKKFYHAICPGIKDLRTMDVKFYDEEYTYCPDCGELMIIPKYAEDIKP